MLHLLAGLALAQNTAHIQRDEYGVPHIKAPTWEAAFRAAGYAVAEDRLWQMEQSRRLSRGKMAEAFGPSMVASDTEVLRTGYTDEELQKQIDGASPRLKAAFTEYTKGINDYIEFAKSTNKLPPGYAQAGFQPEPWTVVDSAAISVRMGQMFGRGGAGEIRNLALLGYLKGQAGVKDRVLDVLDDFAWQNEPTSIPTVMPEDDPLAKNPPQFPPLSRQISEAHVKLLPETNLFELLPGVRLASLEDSKKVAEHRGVIFKTGSYCVVVSPTRSATGRPLLMSGPQMGFTTPSIIHEMSIEAPGINAVGLDVPGIPGVIIGHSRDMAWGFTSGVADTDDIFFSKMAGADGYMYGTQRRDLTRIKRTLKVKGGDDVEVTQTRTHFGPVVVTSGTGQAYFSRHSSYWMKEMAAFDGFYDMYAAKTPADIMRLARNIPLTFNCFYATKAGDIGYVYCGFVPVRAAGLDPRFPTPGTPANEWKGMIPPEKMPRAINPKKGLIANWNNKPVSWWPNFDTPVWGRIFRNSALLPSLTKPKLSIQDLELAAWNIARIDETGSYFAPHIKALPMAGLTDSERDAAAYLLSFDGWTVDGSIPATVYRYTFDALREELFTRHTGSFLSPDLFALAAQPSTMLNALEGKTKFKYLAGRSAQQVVLDAFRKGLERLKAQRGPDPALWGATSSGIAVPGQPPIPYIKRGSYIQLVEIRDEPRGRNVLPPGVAESGPNSLNQVPLARAWMYKPMRWWKD